MSTATKTRARVKPRPKQEAPLETVATPKKVAPPTTVMAINAMAPKLETLYLITDEGLEILIGDEGNEIRDKIKEDTTNNHLAYRHYDDDKRVWTTWAVLQGDGTVKPLSFPDPSDYGMTPPELYTKAATFPGIISEIGQILGEQKETIWDKMMRPAAVIMAIVAVIAFVGFVIISAGG